jgi:hypothetical protein
MDADVVTITFTTEILVVDVAQMRVQVGLFNDDGTLAGTVWVAIAPDGDGEPLPLPEAA